MEENREVKQNPFQVQLFETEPNSTSLSEALGISEERKGVLDKHTFENTKESLFRKTGWHEDMHTATSICENVNEVAYMVYHHTRLLSILENALEGSIGGGPSALALATTLARLRM